jgi:hypothetical protein
MSKPSVQAATVEKMKSTEAYLLDNGEYIYFYLGNRIPDSFIQNVSTDILTSAIGVRLSKLP